MSETFTALYDGHGHSTNSDGRHTPEQIATAAHTKNQHGQLDIVGLSDHDTIRGQYAFLNAIAKSNQQGSSLLAIPSIEIMTHEGDVLIAIPDQDQAENFFTSYKPDETRRAAVDVIEQAVGDFNAFCVLLHPGIAMINGATFKSIETILHRLSNPAIKNLGLEVHNWMAQLFFWNRSHTEAILKTENKYWNLAEFAFTDYHEAGHVARNTTEVTMDELSPAGLLRAVQNRQTRAIKDPASLARSYPSMAANALLAEAKTRAGIRHKPKAVKFY